MNEFFTLMKSELAITAIIFLLLFIKIGKGMKNEALLSLIQVLLLINFIAGFFFNKEGHLFGDMFYTSSLIVFQKNILSLGVYLISLLCADWLKKTEHLPEFFILMLICITGHVPDDLQWKSADLLFIIGTGHHPGCSHGQF